jgi:hypothetical protein
MDNPPSIVTDTPIQFISIDCYLETGTFILYAVVNAKRSVKKATDWSGIKNGRSSKKFRLSLYQSIDKKQLCVYVKFECGLSIPFTRKMRSKKVGISKDGLSFFQMAGFENLSFLKTDQF